MLKVLAMALLVAASLVMPAQAQVQQLTAMDSGQIAFVMPSGNIGCVWTPEGGTDVYMPADGGPELICERIEPSYVTIIMSDVDEAQVIDNPDEQSCCGADNVFDYGNVIELDGFECESAEDGLTCENDDGFGFSMARAGIDTFESEDDGTTGDVADDEAEEDGTDD